MVKYIMRRIVIALAISSLALAQTSFETRVKALMSRPEYRHSRFGMEFYSLDQGKVLYAWNPQELFIPGSTTAPARSKATRLMAIWCWLPAAILTSRTASGRTAP